jgi:hypothetical protein
MTLQIAQTTLPAGAPPRPCSTIREFAGRALHAIDEYTKPREETEGNISKHSYFLGCSISDGISVMGLKGLLGSLVAPAVGITVANKTGKATLGILAGTATATALGVGLSLVTGAPMLQTAVFSGLLGAYETFRGNPRSEMRDAASGANILGAPVLHGPIKMACGIGAAAGTKMKSKIGKALIGGAVSGLVGAAVAAIGLSPLSIPVAIGASVIAGAAGPFFGPRFSQFFRNLSNDIGTALGRLAKRLGAKKELDTKTKNIIGSFPSSVIKEGIRSFALSDGSLTKTLVACAGESFKQGYIFYKQVKPHEERESKKNQPS